MGAALEEQETVIQFNRSDPYATIYTSDATIMTKLDKLCTNAPGNYSLVKTEKDKEGHIVGKFYRLEDKKMVSLRKEKRKVELSDEKRQKLSERAKSNFKKMGQFLDNEIDRENFRYMNEGLYANR